MSNSRLEKFIYAICSMDVSDLPVPLSRIEKLWNCLITGETPDFEPLSRNEKYLMAMLDRYDISNLPAPISRGEKLLYKIAVGETDLSDVPGYLSRYEELLKYLIENGGISGGDFEYVLYTLNQSLSTLYSTAEKPVKSAILKGNTKLFDSVNNEVNEPNCPNTIQGYYLNTSTGELISASTSYITEHFIECPNMPFKIRGNNKYKRVVFYDENKSFISGKEWRASGNNDEVILNIPENAKYIKISFSISVNDTTTYTPSSKIELLDDNENNLYLTHIESVKMPVLKTIGKNLFDGELELGSYNASGKPSSSDAELYRNKNKYISVVGGRDISCNQSIFVHQYDKNKNFIKYSKIQSPLKTMKLENNTRFINFRTSHESNVANIQIEYGTVVTSYEPYKTNILTVNEPIELRGIGDVQDTLDCLTGELTERVGEIVLDGSEDWKLANPVSNNNNNLRLYCTIETAKSGLFTKGVISNRFATVDTVNYEGISFTVGNKNLHISINKTKLDEISVNGFKQWLSQNPVTVQYHLETESIKTVDLTTVDQDGQSTKLKTFNDITYVKLSSEGLIPSVDVEVATKISETLATLDPQQLDISNTQNELGQTIDEQTENTDATMMATTEIYEQTL